MANELITALVKAQGEFTSAKKTADNPFFKSKYADLAEVIEAVRKSLSDNGLAFTQEPEQFNGDWILRTVLYHTSGEKLETAGYPILFKENTAQGFGAGITYARRYSLQTLLGLPAEDDDGNQASGNNPKPAGKPEVSIPIEKPAFKQDDIDGLFTKLQACLNPDELAKVWKEHGVLIKTVTPDIKEQLTACKDQMKLNFAGFTEG